MKYAWTYRHYYYQAGWDVSVKQVVPQSPFKLEYHFQAGEVP